MILGMHRSGTSTISGVLHMNKITMGTYQNFWPRPLSQNPKGFYENYDFRKINDQLLKRSGYDVKSYSTNIPQINKSDKLSHKMKVLIEKSNLSYTDWGWKDPRTCLTAMHWANVIEELDLGMELKIIFMARKASSVSRSLKKRNNLSIKQGLSIWESYTKKALNFLEETTYPRYYCSFEDLLKEPVQVCSSLFNFIGMDWDSQIVEKFIDQLEVQLQEKKVTIEFNKDAKLLLADLGFDEIFGARPLERVIQKHIKKPLANKLLFEDLTNGGHVKVIAKNNKFLLKISSDSKNVSVKNKSNLEA